VLAWSQPSRATGDGKEHLAVWAAQVADFNHLFSHRTFHLDMVDLGGVPPGSTRLDSSYVAVR
jgi:hypothetical protein